MKITFRTQVLTRIAHVLVGLLVVASFQAAGAIYQWKGTSNSTWGISANWVPTGGTITVGPAPTNGVFASTRLNVNNTNNFELVYDASLGVTVYSNTIDRAIVVGSSSGSAPGRLRITGGTLSSMGSTFATDIVGNNSTGVLIVDGGNFASPRLDFGANGGGSGTIIVSNGTATIPRLTYNFSSFGNATVELAGGSLTVSNILKTSSGTNNFFNFNGGTLLPFNGSATFFANVLTRASVRNGGARIDTAGYNVAIGQPLVHSTNVADAAIDGGVTKIGNGTLTLTGPNNYTGPTIVNGGGLSALLPVSSSALTVSTGTKFTALTTNAVWPMSSAALTNSTLEFNYGSWPVSGYTNAVMYVTNLAISGSVTCNVAGTGFPVTNLTLLSYGAKVGGGSFTLGTLPAGAAATLVDDGANVILQITAGSIQNLIWSGGSDFTWQTNGGANWNGNTATYLEYPSGVNDVATFNDTASGNVTISNQVNPSGITVDVTTSSYTFNGPGSIIGTNGITKLGTSTLTINNSNNFTGNVTISGGSGTSGGTLYVNNPDALGSTNGGTIVNGPANTLELGTYLGSGVGVTNETVTISGTGLGGARGALRGQQTTSGENVWAGPVIIGTDLSRIGTEDSGNLTVAGPISDGGANLGLVIRPGANGVVTISGNGSSYGYTRTFGNNDGSGTVKLGANNALSTNRLDLGAGPVDLNGFSQTFGGINDVSGPGRIVNNGGGASVLNINTSSNNFFTLGDIQDGSSTVAIVKLGTGRQILAGTNLTYAGTTTVSEGQLTLATPGSMNSSITVAGGATLAGEPTTTGSLTLNANATLIADASTALSLNANTIDATASPIKVSFSSAPPTNVPTLILTAPSGITGSAGNFQSVGVRGGTFYLTNSNTELMFVPAAGAAIVWKGNDGTSPTFWDVITTTNWSNGGSPDLFYTGDAVTFDDTASSFAVAIQGSSVAPASVTFNSASNYAVSGGAISGGTTVAKSGTGTVTLTSGNSYSGLTTINNGILTVQSSSALGSTNAGTAVSSTGALDIGGAAAANAVNLGAELVTMSGAGFGGNGAVVNNGANTQINAVQQMALAGNASIGGLTRWDIRGTGNALDMAGNTLTKSGSNYIALVGTAINNPGNIAIEGGILGLQLAANLGGSSANTLSVGTNGTLEFYQSTVNPTWTLNLTNGSRVWAESGSAAGNNVWAGPVSLNGAAVLEANGGTLTISGSVSGSGSFLKIGPNTVRLEGNNSYSGGTTLTNYILVAASDTALGTGPVTINSNATRLAIVDGVTISNAIVINGGSGESFRGLIENTSAGNATLTNGPITINGLTAAGNHFASTGGGTLTVASPINSSVTVSFRAGTGIFSGGGSYTNFQLTGTILLGGNNGLSTLANLDLGSANGPATFDLAGYNQSLAGISRVSNQPVIITNSATAADSVLTITGTSSYPGLIGDTGISGSQVALVVNGGNLTLSGANTYSGGTVVTNGTLRVNTSTAAGTGTVAVQNGGTLAGNGTISGAATLDFGSALAPGNSGIGTLTFSSSLAIGGNVAVELDKSLAQSNDLVSVTGSLNNTGTGQLIVSNLGPALVAGDTFALFNQPVVNGNLLNIVGPAGVTFTNDLVNSGSISVLSVTTPPTIPTTPTNITFSATSSNLTIGWPSNYTGWTLQSQTNLRSVGLKTNWFDMAGSELTNAVTIPINKVDPTVFFRLIYTNAP